MKISEDAKRIEGVEDAVIAMGTTTNKELIRQLALMTAEGEHATQNDLIIALRFKQGSNVDLILRSIEELLSSSYKEDQVKRPSFQSVQAAIENLPDANLALVSVPGDLAYDISMQLLNRGIHVHLFSDHVSIKDEVRLKRFAKRNGLLLLGPSSGTSIINGKGIAFANNVNKGDVGIVAAAGTGLQEVAVLLNSIGLGISQALGVGGNDLSRDVNGIMTIECIKALNYDKATSSIVVVSKQPDEHVAKRIVDIAKKRVSKPMVFCFIGMNGDYEDGNTVRFASNLHSAVVKLAKIYGGEYEKRAYQRLFYSIDKIEGIASRIRGEIRTGKRYVRGLFTGGSFVHECLAIYNELGIKAYSNTPLTLRYKLRDPNRSQSNSIVDLGDEYFTQGRAHPMIDPTIRRVRLINEASDLNVAVILLDFILGFGSNRDPAGSLADTIIELKKRRKEQGSELSFFAHICGTSLDPQSLEMQEEKLSKAGVILFPSNALMAVTSALILAKEKVMERLERKWVRLFGFEEQEG